MLETITKNDLHKFFPVFTIISSLNPLIVLTLLGEGVPLPACIGVIFTISSLRALSSRHSKVATPLVIVATLAVLSSTILSGVINDSASSSIASCTLVDIKLVLVLLNIILEARGGNIPLHHH